MTIRCPLATKVLQKKPGVVPPKSTKGKGVRKRAVQKHEGFSGSSLRHTPTVDSNNLEHGCRTILVGCPSFFGLGSEDGRVPNVWLLRSSSQDRSEALLRGTRHLDKLPFGLVSFVSSGMLGRFPIYVYNKELALSRNRCRRPNYGTRHWKNLHKATRAQKQSLNELHESTFRTNAPMHLRLVPPPDQPCFLLLGGANEMAP